MPVGVWTWLLAAGLSVAQAEKSIAFPLRTRGRFIVDAEDQRVWLKCVNWYGAHLEQLVANGLNKATPGVVGASIARAGFNCVRLPFSLDGVLGNASIPHPEVSLAACPSLQASSALEVFDATVKGLTDNGLMVILNNHVSKSMWCCSLSDGEGLWYTAEYPEGVWLEAIGFMAKRYKENPMVIGFDLRNEIRPSGNVWPDWGSKSQTDWAAASVRAAQRVTDANEKMLIIISGLYFSIFLCQVPAYPVHTEVPALSGRVVYTAHEYNWFNFHLLARRGIELYIFLVVAAFPFSWLVMRLLRHLRRKGLIRQCRNDVTVTLTQRDAEQERCSPSCRLTGCGSCLEFSTAAICLLLFALGLKVLPSLIQTCNIIGAYVALFSGMLMPILALSSVVLFTRAAFLALARRAEVRASLNFELPMLSSLEGTESAASEAAALPAARSAGCSLAQQAKCCRSSGCVLTSIMLVSVTILFSVWYEFGGYDAFAQELDFKWGFLSSGASPAPVWLGEFGTSENDLWWRHILRYIEEHETDFAYWAVNGEKYTGVPESFGLFMADFVTPMHPWKLQQLQLAMAPKRSKRSWELESWDAKLAPPPEEAPRDSEGLAEIQKAARWQHRRLSNQQHKGLLASER